MEVPSYNFSFFLFPLHRIVYGDVDDTFLEILFFLWVLLTTNLRYCVTDGTVGGRRWGTTCISNAGDVCHSPSHSSSSRARNVYLGLDISGMAFRCCCTMAPPDKDDRTKSLPKTGENKIRKNVHVCVCSRPCLTKTPIIRSTFKSTRYCNTAAGHLFSV